MVTAEAPAPSLTDEQIDAMSQEEILVYFNRIRERAQARGIPLPVTRTVSAGGGVSVDSLLSRAGIHARAEHAFQTAKTRRDTTEANFNTVVAAYLKETAQEALPEAIQERIAAHVREAEEKAQSGYAKVSATNKGKRKGSVETAVEATQSAESNTEGGEGDTSTEG